MTPDAAADQALVRASFDSAPDALVVIAADGRQVAMNARFLDLWRFPPDMLARRDLDEMRRHVATCLLDPEAFARGNERIRSLVHSAVVDEMLTLDGRSFERHVSPLDAAGFAGARVVRWRETTDRRNAEMASRQARARLAAVFDQAREAILLADDQARYLDANPAAERLLGRSRSELLNLRVADIMGLSAAEFGPAWQAFLQQGSGSGQVSVRRPDGSERIARFNAVARIQSGVHLSILADATEEVLAQRRQLEAATQLELAMTHAELVFWSVDMRTRRITLADPGWPQRTLGYAPGEVSDEVGAISRLMHPDDVERRQAAWQAHVEGRTPVFESEFRMRHRDGRWLWMLARGRAIERDANGQALRLVGMRLDITRRKLAEQELEARAFTDGLTGTLNRRRFIELAEIEVSRAQRHGQPVALLMVDLDHFKQVNDRHGHAGGDAVLRAFAVTAQSVMRGSDLLGRVGGEEFAALLPQTDLAGASALAHRLQALVRGQPAHLAAGPVGYTVSIGVAGHPGSGGSPDTSVEALMLAADTALYRAKDAGRDRVLLAGAPG